MDLTTISNEDLDALRVNVQTEIERRARLDSIPAQVAQLVEEYTAAGGDPTDLAV